MRFNELFWAHKKTAKRRFVLNNLAQAAISNHISAGRYIAKNYFIFTWTSNKICGMVKLSTRTSHFRGGEDE